MSENRWLSTGNFFTSYQSEQKIYDTYLDKTISIIFISLLFLWPHFIDTTSVQMNSNMGFINNILVAIVAVIGLNLLTGFAGLISIGHAAFVGTGAYAIASISQIFDDSSCVLITHFWPLMILFGGSVGAVFGALCGLPALRLKHLYLTIATLSFQMIFIWIINFMTFFKQGQTIDIGRVFWLGGEVTRAWHYTFWYYITLFIIVMSWLMIRNLLRTRYGRCLIAVRDNDRAADAMGMHPGLTKVYAFALAGFMAGIAGALHSYISRGVGFESLG